MPSFTDIEDAPVSERLENILRVLGSDAAVADALGVSPRRLQGWREGRKPRPEHCDRIIGFDSVLALLTGYLADSSIPKWLHGVNPHLGDRRPIHLLREGHVSDLIAAIEAEKSGAFA